MCTEPHGEIPYIEPWPDWRDQAYEFDNLYLSDELDECRDDDDCAEPEQD